MANKNRSGGGNRKHDRNKIWCKAYRARGQREKNKAVRLQKHLVRYPEDRCAVAALNRVAPAPALKIAA
jgi:hypothetical protein